LLEVVRSTDADVYVTSDLRHHPVLEHVEAGGCTLVNVEHSAAEAVWLPQLASALTAELSVPVVLSKLSTSAWAS
jgi:putative NIF3 family GTP cyclohydrolase 1 type 2